LIIPLYWRLCIHQGFFVFKQDYAKAIKSTVTKLDGNVANGTAPDVTTTSITIAPIKSRMETLWCWLARVAVENAH